MKLKYYTYSCFFLIFSLLAFTGKVCGNTPCVKTWTKSDSLKIADLINIAWDNKTSNIDEAIEAANEAIGLSENLCFQEGMANGLHTLGIIKWYTSEWPNALIYFLEALEIRENINDQLGLGRSYSNIGNVYFKVAKYDIALSYYQKSLKIRESLHDTLGLVFSLSNIGDVYLKQNNTQEAFSFYKRSEVLAIASKDLDKLSYIKGRLGDFVLKKNFLLGAQVYWEEALALAKQSGNKHQLAICLCKTAELALRVEDTDLTILKVQVLKALVLAREIKNIGIQGDAILLLAEVTAANGDYEEAFLYKQEYPILMSALWAKQEGEIIDEIKINFDTRKLTKELIQKEEALSLQLNRLWLFLLIFSFFLIIFLVRTYKKRYKEQIKLNKAIKDEMKKVARKNKALKQSNEVLEKFAYAASHDLKEPLRNIGAFTDLLKRRNKTNLTPESSEYITFILDATRHLHRVLDDLLDFVKLTHPPSKEMETINMSSLFSNWINQNQNILRAKNINIEVAPLPIIQAYPELISDLIKQLLNNAIKFHEPNTAVYIKVQYKLAAEKHIFSIKDNGIGINLAYEKKIFETFQRLDKHNFSGTGMGLALCKRIIRHHNGQLWLESEEGKGSCFYFSLSSHDTDLPPEESSGTKIEYRIQTLVSL